jgi:hypothetical protein
LSTASTAVYVARILAHTIAAAFEDFFFLGESKTLLRENASGWKHEYHAT